MLLIISLFLVQKLFSLMLSHLFICDLLLWCHIKKCIIIKTKVKAQGPFQNPPVGLRSVHLISPVHELAKLFPGPLKYGAYDRTKA